MKCSFTPRQNMKMSLMSCLEEEPSLKERRFVSNRRKELKEMHRGIRSSITKLGIVVDGLSDTDTQDNMEITGFRNGTGGSRVDHKIWMEGSSPRVSPGRAMLPYHRSAPSIPLSSPPKKYHRIVAPLSIRERPLTLPNILRKVRSVK